MSATDDADAGDTSPETVEEAIDHIETRSKALRDEQLERALARIDERGDLTPKKRVVLAAMADRLASRLTDPAKTGLRAAAQNCEETAVQVALDLFNE